MEIIHGVYIVAIEKIPLQTDNTFCGVYVQTNKQVIKALIDDYNLVHEKFGVVMFHSAHITSYIGLTIESIEYGREIDKNLVSSSLTKTNTDISLDTCPHIIINIETNNGLIQIVIYNEHDGAYPHHAYIAWDDEYKYQIL